MAKGQFPRLSREAATELLTLELKNYAEIFAVLKEETHTVTFSAMSHVASQLAVLTSKSSSRQAVNAVKQAVIREHPGMSFMPEQENTHV